MTAKVLRCGTILVQALVFFTFIALNSYRIANAGEEQALIVSIRLPSGNLGDANERKQIVDLEQELSAAIKESGTGEFDGDDFGKGFCTIYMYGPSADRLYSVTRPVLKTFHPPTGSYLIKRYGKPGSKQERLSIARDAEPHK